MKFVKGDKVMAKWPGSNLYYQAVVLETGVHECKVLFEEGSDFYVNEKFIRSEKSMVPKVPARSETMASVRLPRSPSRGPSSRRSPGRGSPGRGSPGRRSPGRRSPARRHIAHRSPTRQSPGRKSPTRRVSPTKKLPSGVKSSVQKSSTGGISAKRSPIRKKLDEEKALDVTEFMADKIAHKLLLQEEIKRMSADRDNSVLMEGQFTTVRGRQPDTISSAVTIRRSTRVAASKEFDSDADIAAEIEAETAADEKLIKPKENFVLENPEKSIAKYYEFGGWVGASVLIWTFPAMALFLHIYSNMVKEGLQVHQISTDWKKYFDLPSAGIVFGFVIFQSILSLLPVGKIIDGQPNKEGILQYRCNGLLNIVLTEAVLGAFIYYKVPVDYILDKMVPLMVSSIMFAWLISIAIFIRGGRASVAKLSPYGNTGIPIYDFYMGREINPRIGRLDVKVALQRIGIIGIMVVDSIVLIKSYETRSNFSPTLVLTAGMQIFYVLDLFWFEDTFSTTFQVMYEGVGYMSVMGHMLYPFLPPITTKFIMDHRVRVPKVGMALIILVYIIGYVIYRSSNSQKNAFRKNPLNPALAHMDTIPTSRGKRLLVTGWWGWMRHPNYLGDILMNWMWTLPCGLFHWIPYIWTTATTMLLLHRIKRDEARCKNRYNSAWECYTRRVKYSIFPKVY